MSFTVMAGGLFATGLLALAAGLYALQRLRVRHRELVVPTTLFWRDEIEEQRARTLVERFRHPLTYALCLALATLLWLGVARPDADRSDGLRHVLLLDASAAAMGSERFEAAKEALLAELDACPRDRTQVLRCGADVGCLLEPGEDRALLGPRLDAVQPGASSESLTRAIRGALSLRGATRFVVFGDGAPDPEVSRSLRAGSRIERGTPPPAGPAAPRVASLGLAPSRSGRWDRADLLAHIWIGGPEDVESAVLWDLGEGLEADASTESIAGGVLAWARDVPLDGRRVEVQVAGGASPLARASLVLPERPLIRVQLGSGAGTAVAAVLAQDPAVTLVDRDADVAIGVPEGGGPGVAFIPAADQDQAILVTFDGELDPEVALDVAVGEIGLDRVDGQALAERLGRIIEAGAIPGPHRRVALWSELLDEDAGFTSSRAFPLVLSRAVRWVADAPPLVPYVNTGQPEPHRAGAPHGSPRLATAGAGTGLFGTFSPARGGEALPASRPEGAGGWRPATWILLLALLLLALEWFLHRTGKIA